MNARFMKGRIGEDPLFLNKEGAKILRAIF